MSCPLCDPGCEVERLSDRVWQRIPKELWGLRVIRCVLHGQWMIAARQHGDWHEDEKREARWLKDLVFPGRAWVIDWDLRCVEGHAQCHVICKE